MASLAELLDYDQRKKQMLDALQTGFNKSYSVADAFTHGLADQVGGVVGLMTTDPRETIGNLYNAGKAVVQNPRAAYQAAKEGLTEAVSSPENIARFAGQNFSPADIANALNKVGIVRKIVSPEQAKTLSTKLELPSHEEFNAAVANTPGAEITPEGLKLKVLRQQLPEQAGYESVRTGVFYLPASDPNKHYYSGKAGYGGAEKFEGDTLLQRPLFVKGATGGNAPAQAYDQIMGKGAYENMRKDAISVFNAKDKIGATMDVLNKYGANPDLAHEIVRNSKKVNQLPYAIQENIVAHAVRDAGYDSVLGYSKAKTGPRLSELFDVRELTYPAEGIEPSIHEKFW